MKKLSKFFALTILISTISISYMPEIYAQSLYDIKQTTLSDMEFYVANNGILSYNAQTMQNGLIYPRGSNNKYLFAAGTWFGTKKRVNDTLRDLVTITYNANTARSWMNPGNIGDPTPLPNEMVSKYNVERSTDYSFDGVHKSNQMPPWSLWKANELDGNGTYEPVTNDRNNTKYKNGIATISDEMFHTRYRDNDLNRYDGNMNILKSKGYPVGLQFDDKIYTWQKAPNNSSIIVLQTITNTSSDTLFDSYIGNVFDPDISINTGGVENDNVRKIKFGDNDGFYAWSDGNKGEVGNKFGYMAITHLETPAVNNDVIRSIKYSNQAAPLSEQIGTTSISFFSDSNSFQYDTDRYQLLSSSNKETKRLNQEIKVLMSTGPFTLLPGQTVRIAYCITIVLPANGAEPTDGDTDLPAIKDAVLNNKQNYLKKVLLSVQEKTETKNWAISPNPIADQFSLQYNRETGGDVRISLINLTGAKVADLFSGLANAGANNYNFNLANYGLAAGVYTLQIESGGNITTQKVVIAR